jgi:hypothetical protein
MFEFFKKKEKEYKEAEFRIFRYRTPKLHLGNNIIGNQNKIIRLKDIIVQEIGGMCELNDDGLIGHSPMFVDSILDKPLTCEYAYAINCDGSVKFFNTIEECLEFYFYSFSIYSNPYKNFSPDDRVSTLKYIDIPIILEFMMDKCIPVFINDNYEIFKDRTNALIGYHSIEMNSFMNALPKIFYGSFYMDSNSRIVHSISEELLTMDIIETKSAPYKPYANIPGNCFDSNGFVFYKSDVIEYSNYKEYLRLNKSFLRDRKIESILN